MFEIIYVSLNLNLIIFGAGKHALIINFVKNVSDKHKSFFTIPLLWDKQKEGIEQEREIKLINLKNKNDNNYNIVCSEYSKNSFHISLMTE